MKARQRGWSASLPGASAPALRAACGRLSRSARIRARFFGLEATLAAHQETRAERRVPPRQRGSGETLRLARGREHGAPEFAVEVETLAALRDDADGNVDELAVEIADD